MWFHQRAWAIVTAALAGGACTLALYHWIVRTARISVEQGAFWFYDDVAIGWGLAGCALLPCAAMLARDRWKMLSRLAAACCPWILLGGIPFLSPNLLLLGVGVAIFGWGVFRLGYLFAPVLPRQEIPESKAKVLTLLIWGMVFCYGYLAQVQAHHSLFFIYGDWSQYAEHYLNLLAGAPFRAWLAGAGHFNPLVNVVMTGALAVHRAPETIFFINALLVSSAVPLSYALARKRGAAVPVSLAVALAAMLNPALSHQYLGFIYGFHPIAFMVPLMLLYFLFEKSPWRWLFFGASLLVQETAAVFWGGYGFYKLLFSGERKLGAAMMAGLLCWFFAIGHWVLPWTHGAAQYTQMFHYAALGDSLWQAALSPVLRPGAFWKAVLHPQSLSFVLLSIVPLWFAVGADWRKIAAVLPLYAGVCMQDSPMVKTIALQYSMEISVWFLVVTACCWGKNQVKTPVLWRKGLPAGSFSAGSVWAVLAVTGLSWFLVGYAVPYGKYSIEWGVKTQDIRPDLAKHEDVIIKADRFIATSCLRNHFLFRGKTVLPISADPQPGDAVFLEMHNPLFDSAEILESMRLQLVRIPGAVFAGGFPCGVGWTSVWYVTDSAANRTALPVLSEMEYARLGDELPSGDPHFRVRVRADQDSWHFAVRVESVPEYDVDLGFQIGGETCKVPFGMGGHPAYLCPAGTVWVYSAPHGGCKDLSMLIFKRAGSADAWKKRKKEHKKQ